MELFSSSRQAPPAEVAARTAASKLSNGCALLVHELAREPAKGLLHVVAHVQKSVPGLIEAHQSLEAVTAQMQAVLEELQDAQEGVLGVTSPALQADLAALSGSLDALARVAQQQQQQLAAEQERLQQQQHHQQQQQQEASGQQAASGASSSLAYLKLWPRRGADG